MNETTNREWRIRNAARDIGAFESTSTNNPIGPYDAEPRPVLSVTPSTGSVMISWPLFAQDFLLEQSGASLTTWSNAPCVLVTNATGITATPPTMGGNSFFRLRH